MTKLDSQTRIIGLVQTECTDDMNWNLDETVRGVERSTPASNGVHGNQIGGRQKRSHRSCIPPKEPLSGKGQAWADGPPAKLPRTISFPV